MRDKNRNGVGTRPRAEVALLDAALLEHHGSLVAAVVPASDGLYSAEVIALGCEGSATVDTLIEALPALQDPVAQLAMVTCLLDNVETSGLMDRTRLLAFIHTTLTA